MMLLKYRLIGCVGFFCLLTSSHYWLPVKEVWYGHEVVVLDRMATPYAWEKLIQSWDWVECYSLTWVYPAVLKVDLVRKEAIAKTRDDRYVSRKSSFFNLGENKIGVPILDVPDEHISMAVSLMKALGKVESIYEHPSGTIEVILETQDKVMLPGYNKPRHYDDVLGHAKLNKHKVSCDFRGRDYANCYEWDS